MNNEKTKAMKDISPLEVAQKLEDEGLDKFIKPFDVLLETLKSMVTPRDEKEGNA
jgi:hypothetical protein